MAKRLLDDFSHRLTWDELDTDWFARLIDLAWREDLAGGGLDAVPSGIGDATTETVIQPGRGEARLIARKPMTLAGLPLVNMILERYSSGAKHAKFRTELADGAHVAAGHCIGVLLGEKSVILTAERVILNFLQRLTGVATETQRYVAALGDSPTRLLDTRKTTPGYRVLEKYAVACGGGWNHRIGLYDRIMLKDNHLAAEGADKGARLASAVKLAKRKRPDLGVEVEVDELEQIPPVLEAGADVIMLDNFGNERLSEAISLIGDKSLTEASGGITIERLPSLATLGLDFISTGATVHQAAWVDIGLDWQ
ncbi:carboxylating nicotinate-nucleotide diphosphorylase [Cerasicoccus maritimus]|uniref:carboxylating nicotinate-nucleotide diphosphorylase n=1 Tax=Cerasicoccus maritimus TaxID=490089 RepID=UPI0028529705|nr:carboxylating nicotinate-nucleotide diphosphorylase [Cerasicoccus maritimus]